MRFSEFADRAVEAALRVIDPAYDRLCGQAEALEQAGPPDFASRLGELAERASLYPQEGR